MNTTDPGMNDEPSRPMKRPLLPMTLFLYGVALVLSVVLLIKGERGLGIAGVMLVLTIGPVAFALVLGDSERSTRALIERVDEVGRSVKMLADQSVLSDEARRIINRRDERDLLVMAIEEDIDAKNWDASMVLIKELAERFGYRAEAEKLRSQVEEARRLTREREITDAVTGLDALILQRRWEDSYAEAGRMSRLFAESRRIQGLRDRVEDAHKAYKRDLERRFLMAAQEERTDEALSLLKELDQYLTPTEAEPLRELARGVIGKARVNSGAQFKLAVQDQRWPEAVRLGEEIIKEFPNTRMAAEVREVLDGIRLKAGGVGTRAV